jgi:transposase
MIMGFIDAMRAEGHAVEPTCRVLREQGFQAGRGSRAREATATDSPEGCWRLESPCSKVNRPDRANRRRKGKSDPVDAEGAARAVLSGQAAAIPKDREGAVESLRSLTLARSSAVKATTTGSNQIKALLVGADQDLRESLTVKSLLQLATRASRLPATTGMSAALGILGRQWLSLHQKIVELDVLIRDVVRRTVPALLTRPGVGIHSAAQLLITAGGNPGRLHSDAAFAALCGVSPVRASSGQRQRHRLNRGGDRDANHALWTIANNRMIHHARTREFPARRAAEKGDTRKDTLRVLKRYIARETFTLILKTLVSEEVPTGARLT